MFGENTYFEQILGSGPTLWGQNSAGLPWPKSWIRPCPKQGWPGVLSQEGTGTKHIALFGLVSKPRRKDT